MTDTIWEQMELEIEGMKVVLEFPREPEQEDRIKGEVKDILACALQEYLEKTVIFAEQNSSFMQKERSAVKSNG